MMHCPPGILCVSHVPTVIVGCACLEGGGGGIGCPSVAGHVSPCIILLSIFHNMHNYNHIFIYIIKAITTK